MKLFLSPHNDDAVLFGAFTIQRERPLVVTVLDSYLQRAPGVTYERRRAEDEAALAVLGCDLEFLGFSDTAYGQQEHLDMVYSFERWKDAEMVYAPAIEKGGHAHHNLIGKWASEVFPRVTFYTTYTRTHGKTRTEHEVIPQSGEHIRRKLQALACYESQIDIEALGCRPHFMNDLREYYAV